MSANSSSAGESNGFLCSACGTNFTAKRNWSRHVKKFHPTEYLASGSGNVCSICDGPFECESNLQEHMSTFHDINFVIEKKIFYCMQDFENWKCETEKASQSHFVKHRGDQLLADGRTVMYFYCHRSGNYVCKVPDEQERKRRIKNIGTQKIGKACPARIIAHRQTVNEATEIEVEYRSTHIGHRAEIGRMPLLKQERNHLAQQLNQGIPSSKILDRIGKSFSSTRRLCLTTKQDLQNVCRDFKIDQEVIFHKNDAISVDIRVRKMQQEDGNPVLIYKPIGTELSDYPLIEKKEFLLGMMNDAQLKLLQLYRKTVMIDSTHGTNQYGFQLTTLMVHDGNHEGFPVATLYSTRTAAETFIPFFEKIKERCPDLKPDVFMSDDAPAFYNAWKTVFSEVKHYLLCSWHVIRSWNSNLNSKIKDIELREVTRGKIKQMMKETDFNTFKQMSHIYVPDFLACNETKLFGEYFHAHYMNRVEQWAYCFRLNCGINTNMKVERWHKQIKYEDGEGKVIRRLDKSISIVLSAITKKLIRRMIKVERCMLNPRTSDIRKRHDRSKEMSKDLVLTIKEGKMWTVNSSKASTSTMFLEVYTVMHENHNSCCQVKCQDCNICIHQFSCTCHDYSIRFFICKHIHLVCCNFHFGSSPPSQSENSSTDLIIDVTENEVHINEEQLAITKQLSTSTSSTTDEEQRARIMSKVQSYISGYSSEKLKDFENMIDIFNLKTSASSQEVHAMSNVSNEPANKFIKPQQRMFSRLKLKRKRTDDSAS